MKKIFTLFPVLWALSASANHIVGGFISYRYLSGTTYEVKLTAYRDCNSTTPFDGTPGSSPPYAYLALFDASNNLVTTYNLTNPVIRPILAPSDNPCLLVNSNVCVEEGVYTVNITMPSATQGYTLIYERCCRNNTITNVFNPGDQGAAYVAYVPPTNSFHNSSPTFTDLPPLFICVNSPLVLNYSATDIDGDVLTYSLCTPFTAGNTVDPAPLPPFAPPFATIPWQTPYSAANMLGGVPLAIDPNTGVLTGTPNMIGQFVVGVCVSEYRNGQLIATYPRDFQFNVTQCNIPVANIPSANINPNTGIGIYTTNCTNYTVTFQNNTYNPPPVNNPLSYHWDFGVPGVGNDTSNLVSPTFTYPDTGTYLVKLIAVKSTGAQPCTDTTYAFVKIYPTFTGNFATADVCQATPALFTDLSTATIGNVNAWSWNFGDGQSDNTPNPSHQYNAPGTYTVTLVSQSDWGCKDTVQKTINILPSAVANFSFPNPVCEVNPVHFTNSSVPASADFLWDLGNGTTSSAAAPSVTYSSGTYPVKLFVSVNGNCPDSITQILTVNPNPKINLSNDTTVCPGAAVQLWAHDGISYLWSPADGLNDSTLANPVATPLAPNTATYSVTVTNQFQCTTSGSIHISFFPPASVNAGVDTSVCLSSGNYRDSVQLTAGGALSYQWQPTASLDNPNSSSPVAKPTTNTTYLVTGTDANGCEATDSVTVFVLDPTLNIVIDDYVGACPGDTAYAHTVNQGASAYQWSPADYLTDATALDPGFFPPDTADYVLTVANYCYTKSDTLTVLIFPLPDLVLDDVDSTCYRKSIALTIDGAQSYLWDSDSSIVNTATATPTVMPDTSRFYYVDGTNSYGCVRRDSVWVEVMPLPYVNAGNDTIVWRGTPALLSGSTDGSSFFWNPETGLTNPKELTTPATLEETQRYYLHATSDYGCTNYDSIKIIIETVTILNLPTAFSPNGDGVNDVFRILNWLNISKLNEFAVYNRWGEKVFYTTDIYQGWDGTFRNTEQPMSVYVWMVSAYTDDGQEIIRKGNVTLLR